MSMTQSLARSTTACGICSNLSFTAKSASVCAAVIMAELSLQGDGRAFGVAASGTQVDGDLIAVRRELAAELFGAGGNLTEDFAFVLQRAEHGLVVVVVADELKRGLFHRRAVEGHFREHADPIAVLDAAVSGMKGEAAETVVDRLAAIAFDRQREMRPVAENHIGTGVDRAMSDLPHVVEDGLIDSPMTRGDDDIAPSLERRDVVAETLQRRWIGPGQDRRRHARPVERDRARPGPEHRHLIGRVAADG